MKHLRKFNESVDFDPAFAISKISNAFTKEGVARILRAEKLNWADSESMYNNLNNGEAEDVIISRMIEWYEESYGDLTKEQRYEICELIKSRYSDLNF